MVYIYEEKDGKTIKTRYPKQEKAGDVVNY